MEMYEFDATRTELLPGINLIEASAGTGKTYAIAMLVLRFVVEREVDIKQLLVVTFTKAATAELKDRIRLRLAEARRVLAGEAADIDPALSRWLAGLSLDADTIRLRLDLALLDIDQAAIFTIHSFCQRILSEHALESGELFDCELTGDISAVRQNCADDFWRRQIYQRPVWQVSLLTARYATPDALLASLKGIVIQQTTYPDELDLDAQLDALQRLFGAAGQAAEQMAAILTAAWADGKFKDSYVKTFTDNYAALQAWLADPATQPVDVGWLSGAGITAGLNGKKFMPGKLKPSSEQQKQQYLQNLHLDSAVFDELQHGLQQLAVILRRALLEYLREQLDKALQQNHSVSFDQLISRLSAALAGDKGRLLVKEIQQRFKVALIDEFQDTDHLQWQIFSQIFTPPHYLYLIGDPKQAIYKFRGADIFTYFAARDQAQHHYTLLHNWRSHPQLVAAVNRLFQRPAPFLSGQLPFHAVQAGRSAEDGQLDDTAPLVLWQLAKNPDGPEHWTAAKAGDILCQAVVNEILDLLINCSCQAGRQDRRPLQAGDIAVLVRTNSQAAAYQQALQAAGIPAILNSKQSVFASAQAQAVFIVLQAVAQPGHIAALKQALTLNWFALDGQGLYQLLQDETALDDWLSRFLTYHQLWQQQGLLVMLQRLLDCEQVEVHLSSEPQAERELTNLYHIMERLQQVSIDEHLTINKTLDWLRHAIQTAETHNNDEFQLRLESDADAVNIVTLHSAKGLEYPVVFCPNLWQSNGRKNRQEFIQCHENGVMIADLGSEHYAEREQQALAELQAEDLRLFYVAVTRAKYRCYLAWADLRSKEKANDSAMAYLLEFADMDFAAQSQVLQGLACQFPSRFQYRLINVDTQVLGRLQQPVSRALLACRPRRRVLFTDWQMSSYTALSALSLAEIPEFPLDKSAEPDDVAFSGQDLPKGAATGNVIHSLLENISFRQLAIRADISLQRNQALSRYGVRLDNPAILDDLLYQVVNSCLPVEPGFCLKDIDQQRCLQEMPFYLAMQPLHTQHINQVLAESPVYQSLSEKQLRGYLTGFIDLVCEYQGKYYIIDYKSNGLANYRPESLCYAMREHNYGLQYYLYTLVIDRYLRQRLPDYRYERDFGGVMYLFVRGMNIGLPGLGVYTDIPKRETLTKLSQVFFQET